MIMRRVWLCITESATRGPAQYDPFVAVCRCQSSQLCNKAIVAAATVVPTTTASFTAVPSLYVLNAAALSKLEAVKHLAADLKGYSVSVAVITETHFKKKHTDVIIGVKGYSVFRRDRIGRKGGGVALYVQSAIQSSRWTLCRRQPCV